MQQNARGGGLIRLNRRAQLTAPIDWLAAESDGSLDRLFGGRIAPLVAYFGSQRKLSPKDIQELRKLIDEFDDGE